MEKTFIGGHIYEGNISGLKFAFDALTVVDGKFEKTEIENGEILIGEENFSGEKYFLRVNDVKYGGNSSWALEMAREHNFSEKNKDISDEHEDFDDPFDVERIEQRFNIAECEILGVSNRRGFVSARTPISMFSKVRKLTIEDFDGVLKESMGDLKIGYLRSGSQILNLKAGIFKKWINTHTFITARTGGGKSNTMKVLNGVMLESGGDISPLIFEPHGEYITDLKRHPLQKERLTIYNQDGRNGDKKLRISYKRVTVESLMNVVNRMKWTEPQERFLSSAQAVFKNEWFKKIVELPYDEEEYFLLKGKEFSEEEADLQDFVDSQKNKSGKNLATEPQLLRDIFKSSTHVDTIRAVKAKLQRIARSPFLTDDDNKDDLLNIVKDLQSGKGVLIDMNGLKTALEKEYLSALLTSVVLEEQIKLYNRDREGMESGRYPVIGVILEECQQFLGKGNENSGNIFRTVVNEGRKYMLGLIGITQQAKLMDPVVLSQMNTHIILGISDETDFGLLSGRVQKSIKNLEMDINQLMPGEAIVSSPSSPFALPLKIYEYNEYIKELNSRLSASIVSNDYSLFD